MAFYNENIGVSLFQQTRRLAKRIHLAHCRGFFFQNRILELLSFPLFDRCHELNILFDRCNLRELQELFPTIVKSVFGIGTGGLGWGLRTTTKENSAPCFDILYNFFSPMGPMFRLCYNLLNDQIKFEMSLEHLPVSVITKFLKNQVVN